MVSQNIFFPIDKEKMNINSVDLLMHCILFLLSFQGPQSCSKLPQYISRTSIRTVHHTHKHTHTHSFKYCIVRKLISICQLHILHWISVTTNNNIIILFFLLIRFVLSYKTPDTIYIDFCYNTILTRKRKYAERAT